MVTVSQGEIWWAGLFFFRLRCGPSVTSFKTFILVIPNGKATGWTGDEKGSSADVLLSDKAFLSGVLQAVKEMKCDDL